MAHCDRSHPVVYVNNVIYLVNNTTCIGNNIKKIRRHVSVQLNHHQAKYKIHSLNVPVLYLVFGLMMVQLNRNMSPNFLILLPI